MGNNRGITLVALVISIIVMLILAGVSLNATVGENGIITQTQKAKIAQKIAVYKEELEMNIVDVMASDGFNSRGKVNVFNENVRKYIPSLEDNDVGEYGIVAGELYYLGEETLSKEMATAQSVYVVGDDMSIEEFLEEVENKAIESIVKNLGGSAFIQTDDNQNQVYKGVQLFDKNFANGNKWKITTEIEDGRTKATYGTKWYFVDEGTEIEGIGKLKYSYIINYADQKSVKFDATKHTMLAYGIISRW